MNKIKTNNPMSETLYSNLNLGDALKAMQICNEIPVKMSRMIGTKDTAISIGIKKALDDKEPYIKVVKDIQQIALENKNIISDIIGLHLCNQILEFGKHDKN